MPTHLIEADKIKGRQHGVNAQLLKQESPAVARERATTSLERFSER